MGKDTASAMLINATKGSWLCHGVQGGAAVLGGVRKTFDERGLLLSGVPGEAAEKDLALESQNALRLGPNAQCGGRFAGIPCLWGSIMSSQTSASKSVPIHESPIICHWKEVPGRVESSGSYDWRSRSCEKEGEGGREGKSLLSAELLLATFL